MRILLHASDERRAESAARAAYARIAALDAMMSDYRPDSELRRLGTSGTKWTPVSPDLLEVLTTAVSVARDTDGAFDPTVGPLIALWREARQTSKLPPASALDAARAAVGWRHLEIDRARGSVRLAKPGMRLDLGGIAKGYILEQGLRTLRMNGVGRALIESGGDIVVGSSPPGLAGWRIETTGANAMVRQRAARLANAALATSGPAAQFVDIDGVRYSHIVDPRTGMALTNQVTAMVIARSATLADALATALSVLGPDGEQLISEKFPDVLVSVSVPGEQRQDAAAAHR